MKKLYFTAMFFNILGTLISLSLFTVYDVVSTNIFPYCSFIEIIGDVFILFTVIPCLLTILNMFELIILWSKLSIFPLIALVSSFTSYLGPFCPVWFNSITSKYRSLSGVCFTTDGTDTYYQENLERLYTYLGGSLENPPSRCSTNTGSNGEEEVSCSITAGFIGVTESGNISIIDFMNGECVIDPELGYYSC